MTVEEPAEGEQVRVLARWNNPARSPAVIERIKGDGRVLLWTTTADRAGNDWPIEPSFVLAVREAVRGTARPTPLGNTITAGERMQRVVQTSQQSLERAPEPAGRWRAGGALGRSRGRGAGKEAPSVEIAVPDTRRAGIYRLSWDEGSTGTQGDIYAANPDPRESALERIEAPRAQVVPVSARGRDHSGAEQRGEHVLVHRT